MADFFDGINASFAAAEPGQFVPLLGDHTSATEEIPLDDETARALLTVNRLTRRIPGHREPPALVAAAHRVLAELAGA